MFPITQVSLLAVNYLPAAQLVLGGWGSYLPFFIDSPMQANMLPIKPVKPRMSTSVVFHDISLVATT